MIRILKSAILHMPPRDLLKYAPLAAVVAVLPLVPLAYFTSRNPAYCAHCHRKSHEPELWRHSRVHPTMVTCIDCHATSRGLILRNFSAQPARINPNCLRCHKIEDVRKIGSSGYQFEKNPRKIRIPHELHIIQVGANCTDCHYNLVHDRREEKTNRPPMEACTGGCHASDAANCEKCHPPGTVEPPTAAEIDPEQCRKCHGDFVARALDFEGQRFIHAKHIRNGVLCGNCHSNARRHGELLVAPSDCESCHSITRPASHLSGWRNSHGRIALSGKDSCFTCHKERFCEACHGIRMPHPAGWRTEHAAQGVGSAAVCTRCHTRETCRGCHMTMVKSPHGRGWLASHGVTARKSDEPCGNCHGDRFCRGCHGLAMPHQTGWLVQHGRHAMSDASACAKCHQSGKKNDCARCHRKMKPGFHNAGFRKTHPKMTERKLVLCQLCHSRNGCDDCHKTQMPHEKGWIMSHKSKGASFSSDSFCFNCHTKQKCQMCHGTDV